MSDEPKAISCPICENICSSYAAACPQCGHPVRPGTVDSENTVAGESSPRKDSGRTALRILWTLFIISLLFGLTAIGIYNNMLYATSYDGPASRAARQADVLGIVVRIAIPAALGLILILIYAVRGRR